MTVKTTSLVSWPNPRWKENPYQRVVNEGLRKNGITIARTPPAFSMLRHFPRCDWVHLNWPETQFADSRPGRRVARLDRFARTVRRVKRRGTKILWTVHNEFPHEGGDEEFYRRANATLCDIADLIHVHFPEAADLLERQYGAAPEAIHVMQHPLYGDVYGDLVPAREARKQFGIGPEAKVILVFGYLRQYKGIEAAVEGFLKTKDDTLRLLVAGKPEDENTRNALQAAAGEDVRIVLRLGHVAPSEVMPLFAAADAFLFPSRRFFTSGSLMLALTYGVPVIAAPVNHALTFAGRSFFNPWEPGTADRLAQLMDSLGVWLDGVGSDVWERVRTEWTAEALTQGLAAKLKG